MSTYVKLTKLVDLAVGSPEPGVVNFNILHALLHVIIQQLELQDTEVEYRGEDAYRIQTCLDTAPPFPTLKLTEYTITDLAPPSKKHPAKRKISNEDRRPDKPKKRSDDLEEDVRATRQRKPDKMKSQSEDLEEELKVIRHVDKPESLMTEKKKVGPRKSGQLMTAMSQKVIRQPSVQVLKEDVESHADTALRSKDDRKQRDRGEKQRDIDGKPRDREDRQRDREDRPRDREDRQRDREDRPRDKEDRQRDREDRPRDREDRQRDREDRPRDKEDKQRDREDRPRDREDRQRDREERPRDREDRPRDREDRPRGREEKTRDTEDRTRDREDRPRGREDRPRDTEDRTRDREERPHEREDRPREKDTHREREDTRGDNKLREDDSREGGERERGKEDRRQEKAERPKERTERPREKEEKQRDRVNKARDREERPKTKEDRKKESASNKDLAEREFPDEKRTTIVRVEHYDDDDESPPLVPAPIAGRPIGKLDKTGSLLRPGVSSSATSFFRLKQTVEELQYEVAGLTQLKLPSNERLLENSRSGTNVTNPFGDMWELIKLTKRMDGAEKGINKLTSIIEDLAKNTTDLHQTTSTSLMELAHKVEEQQGQQIESMKKRVWDMENRLVINESRIFSPSTGGESPRRESVADGLVAAPNIDVTTRDAAPGSTTDLSRPEAPSRPTSKSAGRSKAAARRPSTPSPVVSQVPLTFDGLSPDQIFDALREEVFSLRKDLDTQTRTVKRIKAITDSVPLEALVAQVKELEEWRTVATHPTAPRRGSISSEEKERIAKLEDKMNRSTLTVEGIDNSFNTQINGLQSQMMEMEKELGVILERLNVSVPSGDNAMTTDFSGLGELYNKMQLLQQEMDTINNTADRLMDERDEQQLHANAMLEQIEVLKTIKADKEDIEDLLADKADHNTMNRKVSHDQFDAACDDLSRGVEEALAKLSQQEALWQQALDEVQREIETKLDKVEISPLKDFVNNKLKLLQERLKALAALRRETEAAGTKHRLLRNVTCISCDKDVIMNMDNTVKGSTEGLPPNRSMKPYLTYELDAVRKQQKRLPGSRNMNHFESAVQEQKKTRTTKDSKAPAATSSDHLCNRYCGGSHTITTPQQRVTRMGHFLAQWGPEAVPLRKAKRPPRMSIADKTMLFSPLMMKRPSTAVHSPPTRSPRVSVSRPSSTETVPRQESLIRTTSPTSVVPSTPIGTTPPRTPPREETPAPAEGEPVITEVADVPGDTEGRGEPVITGVADVPGDTEGRGEPVITEVADVPGDTEGRTSTPRVTPSVLITEVPSDAVVVEPAQSTTEQDAAVTITEVTETETDTEMTPEVAVEEPLLAEVTVEEPAEEPLVTEAPETPPPIAADEEPGEPPAESAEE